MVEGLLPGAQHLQNAHPLVVHFPIAFLNGAALFYLLALVFRREYFATTALSLLFLGTASAMVAAATGLYAEPGVMVSRSVRASLLSPHKRYMLAALCLSAGLAVWAGVARPFPRKGRSAFLASFGVLLAILTRGTDYGGRMVYDYNAGGSACSQPIEFTR